MEVQDEDVFDRLKPVGICIKRRKGTEASRRKHNRIGCESMESMEQKRQEGDICNLTEHV